MILKRLENKKKETLTELKLTLKAIWNLARTFWKYPRTDPFFLSLEWQLLRLKVIRKYGPQCMRCGARDRPVHIDHIRPRSKHPRLALRFSNLQVLCEACNLWKGNRHETDYR